MANDSNRLAAAVPSAEDVQRVLAERFGSGLVVSSIERIEPWFVARANLHGQPGDIPPSAIVKWLRWNSSGVRMDAGQLLTERASLEYLEQLDGKIAPRLLAVEPHARWLVVEDVTHYGSLYATLQQQSDGDVPELETFARTMGTLHAETATRSQDYYELRSALGPCDPATDRRRVISATWDWDLTGREFLDIDPSAAESDASLMRQTLLDPGPYDAFSNGDAGANNFLASGTDGRIIDWEQGGYQHALLDAACLFVPQPVWMTVARPRHAVVDSYRQALGRGVSASDDDSFTLGLACSCLAVALDRLQRFAVLESRPAGHHSRSQMVSTLEAAARAAEELTSRLPALTAWVSSAAATLRRRWPDSDRSFADAYTTSE